MGALVLMCSLSACSSNAPCYPADTSVDSLRTIYVVQRASHTGVVIAKADWPNQSWPGLNDFPSSDYLEFGWGDERYYQEENTPWLGTRAALWPTSSVIHVIGLDEPVGATALADDIVAVRVSSDGLDRLTSGIESEFSGDRPTAAGPEIESAPTPNRFYEADRSFYFPRMCNWWIASRLREAGCPIRAWTIVTAPQVMKGARRFCGTAEPLCKR